MIAVAVGKAGRLWEDWADERGAEQLNIARGVK
jgi:hypothetical protein